MTLDDSYPGPDAGPYRVDDARDFAGWEILYLEAWKPGVYRLTVTRDRAIGSELRQVFCRSALLPPAWIERYHVTPRAGHSPAETIIENAQFEAVHSALFGPMVPVGEEGSGLSRMALLRAAMAAVLKHDEGFACSSDDYDRGIAALKNLAGLA